MATQFEIKGAAELQRKLGQLPVKLEKNILRGALRAGAKVIEREAKARVPVKSGLLRDSIRVSVRARRGTVTAQVKAGGRRKGQAFYAWMVEHGTRRHVIVAGAGRSRTVRALAIAGRIVGAKVDHPGAAAHPFMKPSLDSRAPQALDAIRAYIGKRLDKLK